MMLLLLPPDSSQMEMIGDTAISTTMLLAVAPSIMLDWTPPHYDDGNSYYLH